MRRLLVAGFAALAVVLGLTLSVGTAFATAPAQGILGCAQIASPDAKCDNSVKSENLRRVDHGCLAGTHWNGTACVPNPVGDPTCTVDHNPRVPGCQNSGPIYGGHPGGGYGGNWHPGLPWGGPSLYGHQLWVEANLGLDICGYGNSYDTFLNRNLRYRSTIDRLLDRGRWQSLYSSDCNSGLAVLPGGLTLVNGNLLNLSLLGLNGAGTVNVCDYPDYNVFNSRFGGRFGNRWDSVRNRFGSNGFNVYRQLRVNARCTTIVMPSSTTIVQAPNTTVEAAPADPSGSEAAAAPAPLASAQLPANAPVKAPNEGGWSAAAELAHARVA
jgi:hypothetical protein